VLGIGQRGGVDHGVLAGDDRERVAGVGDVGLDVARPRRRGLEHRRDAIGGGDLVAGPVQDVDGGGADLAAGAGDEDSHSRHPRALRRLDECSMPALATRPVGVSWRTREALGSCHSASACA
jgi:hypothetical protein